MSRPLVLDRGDSSLESFHRTTQTYWLWQSDTVRYRAYIVMANKRERAKTGWLDSESG
jgi:hypothetical protein